MALTAHHKYAIIYLFLIIGLLVLFGLLFLVERGRICYKSWHTKKHVEKSAKEQNLIEKIYLCVRSYYYYTVRQKWLRTFIVISVICVVSIPFIGEETPKVGSKTKKNWNRNSVCSRFAYLACVLYTVTYIFSLKNNPFALMFLTSHEKLNYIHRRVSIFALLFGLIHGIGNIGIAVADNARDSLAGGMYPTGYAILTFTVVFGVSSISYIRKYCYEWFFILHHLCSIGLLCTIWLHSENAAIYMKVCVSVYAFDRGLRILRSCLNFSTFRIFLLDDDLIYMRGRKPRSLFFFLPWAAGNHIYLNIPTLSYWQLHPFTMLSSPGDDYVEMMVVVRTGFTKRLADRVYKRGSIKQLSLSKEEEEEEKKLDLSGSSDKSQLSEERSSSWSWCPVSMEMPSHQMTVLLDGPYGPTTNLYKDYSNVLFLSSGVGITYTLPILKDIARCKSSALKVKRITFVWSCRSKPLLVAIFNFLKELVKNETQIQLDITCHYTNSYSYKEIPDIQCVSGKNVFLQVLDDRPHFVHYLRPFLERAQGQTAAIATCGSEGFLKHVKSDIGSCTTILDDLFQHYEEI
ncbi:ferric reductase transmembrane component [Schizosaccharomyces octosporus yFS286]|uniref:ferric-chelate reductase (NADPH) n=1 Tax=Schizosaccharomyces octosporus (strain yFS286) TaxID=483514 RepID=S9RMQ1_SCHOY|nr:ferric reductase transmembrane component [Schizosaccharomyces octosporus yFS286]EPX75234.1 ferric reductase transmembrane component [Schizosaccharomyces octosporus yFS286]